MKSSDHWLPAGGAVIGVLLAVLLRTLVKKLAGKRQVGASHSSATDEAAVSTPVNSKYVTDQPVHHDTRTPPWTNNKDSGPSLSEKDMQSIIQVDFPESPLDIGYHISNYTTEGPAIDVTRRESGGEQSTEVVVEEDWADYRRDDREDAVSHHDGRGATAAHPSAGQRKRSLKRSHTHPPERRGGRPHREVTELIRTRLRKGPAGSVEDAPYRLRCRLDGMEWTIGIEIMEQGLCLVQQSQSLQPMSIKENFYPLISDDAICIIRSSGETETFSLATKSVLVFRLDDMFEGTFAGEDMLRNDERYVVMVRRDAVVQDEGLSKTAVTLDGWVAYLLSAATAKSLRLAEEVAKQWPTMSSPFDLELLGDVIEGIAPQYRAFLRPPTICFRGAAERVRRIVIKLERAGHRWSDSFPVQGGETSFPERIQEQLRKIGAGRFAIRCYDAENRLLGSSDFRLITGLKGVTRTKDDNDCVKVTFCIDPGYQLEPVGLPLACSGDDPQSFIIHPEQKQQLLAFLDLIEWRVIAPNGNGVIVGIDVERIFWTATTDGSLPTPELLGVRPVRFDAEDFRATSAKRLWIWLPKSLRKKPLKVGVVAAGQQLVYPRDVGARSRDDGLIEIPLRSLEYLVPTSGGRYDWYVMIGNESRLVGYLERYLCCKECGYSSQDIESMRRHLRKEHSWRVVEEIDVVEIWLREGRALPDRVYVCRYCGKGFAEGGYENANTAVTAHQRTECEQARAQAQDGPIEERIRILERSMHSEAELIQALVDARWRCRLCGARLTEKERYDHLPAIHFHEMTKLR